MEIVPLWFSIIFFDKVRPSPAPFVLREASPLKNGLNILSIISLEIPIPVSSMLKTYLLEIVLSWIVIVPFSEVYFIALSKILTKPQNHTIFILKFCNILQN